MNMEITHAAPGKGPSEIFTGDVAVTPLFKASEHLRASAGSVTFQAGARSPWHTHPMGQMLVIISGTAWVQEWGGPKQEVHAGDVIWTQPGVKHWHGASAKESVTHIAIQEGTGGRVVDWLEPVTDEQYGQ
jgi:quercetin dioxygenase-like cupin family protein